METSFTSFDFLTFSTLLVCIVLSTARGFVSELFDFGGWVISLIFARALCISVAEAAFPNMEPYEMAVVFAFVLVFIIMRLLQYFLRSALNKYIYQTKLNYMNRLMGCCVGLMKGLFIISLVVLVCAFTPLPERESWQRAISSRFFENMAAMSVPYLPPFLGEQVLFPERIPNAKNNDHDTPKNNRPPSRKPKTTTAL